MVGGTVAAGTNGLDFLNTASMGLGNLTGAFGLGLMGASLVGSVLVSATPSGLDVHATSPESGLIRGGAAGVGSTGMGSVATSPFGGLTVGSDSSGH